MILASVVEKEERNTANKPTVAGIFLKRLEI
jgi:cell division protein YceG involved in septum cleavage